MALFDGNIGSYTTPDGRVVQYPDSFAAQFPDLRPVQPQMPIPTFAPGEVEAATPPADASMAPVTTPRQVPDAGQPQAPRGAVTNPQQDSGPPNPQQPITNADLQKMGNAGVMAAENAALDKQNAAQQRLTDVDAATATKVGDALVRRDDEQHQLLVQRAQQAQEFQKSLNDRMASYEREAKAIADVKIDRGADRPWLAALGIALGGIGAAMAGKGDQNPALAAFYQAIDRKVAGQMQDLDKRRASLGLQRDSIGMQREMQRDRLAEMDQQRIAALDQASREIETIKNRSASDRVRANGDVMQADIAMKRAAILDTAATREATKLQHEQDRKLQMQMHAQTIGVQLRGQNLEQKRFEAGLEEKQRERDMLAQEKADALLAKYGEQAEKAAKDKRERGISDPTTGDYMLTPNGKDKLKKADELEALARKGTDAKLAAKQREQAKLLRESAALNDAEMAPDEETARKLRTTVSATDTMYDSLQSAKDRLEKDPSAFDRDAWAQISTSLMDAQAKYMAAIGERVSPRAFEAIKGHAIALDPEDIGSRTFSKEKAMASINELMRTVSKNIDSELRANHIKSGWQPRAPSSEEKFSGKTSQEIAAEATPSPASRAATRFLNPLGGDAVEKIRAPSRDAENAAIGNSNYGLDPSDEAKVKGLVQQADSAGDAKRAQIIDSLAQPILSDRPGLFGGITGILRDTDPKLLQEVIARVAVENPQLASQLSDMERARAKLPGANIPPPGKVR